VFLNGIPKIDIDGFNCPSELNRGTFSIFANALLGFGSEGVPLVRINYI
jgi:hypothetical protein